MSSKTFLPGAACFIFLLIFFSRSDAQQRRSDKGKLFINELRPRVTTPRTPIRQLRLHTAYRSYDGTNNNISSNDARVWGAADISLFREMAAEYNTSDPNNAMAGANRPSPRKISNLIIDEPVTVFNSRGLSAFVYVWGQFLDHDMSLTPTGTTEYVPVALPEDETVFTEQIPFYRSEVRTGTGINNVRQQTNLNTSWIDASMVYGGDSVRAVWMRTLKNGKMKISTGNFLPYNTITGEKDAPIDPNAPSMANDGNHTVKTFIAGDVRAAEHPGLIGLHTVFVREHNRICDLLRAKGITNDEELYQRARKEVGAMIQAITYQEFLPAIGVTLTNYAGYKPYVRPDITNNFATAGYRIGHTMVADDIMLINNQCEEVEPGEFDLIEVFWNPQLVVEHGLEPFLKGFAAHTQYETDTKINSVLRNFLFGSPNDSVRFGIDLGSLNIQRGRDHGLPNYNAVRKFYTGTKVTSFSQITSNTVLAASLKTLYGTVDNIDLWVGILAEDRLPRKSVGFTMHAILKKQFENLRDGDYYYYKNDPFLPATTSNQLKNTRFSDVLKRNTSLTNLQSNVFFTDTCPASNAEVPAAPPADTVINNTNADFTVHPNPVGGILTIKLGNSNESYTVKIFSSNGVLMKTIHTVALHENALYVNVSNFKDGAYIVTIESRAGVKSLQFLKMSE